jgi:hypothetical protein
VATARGSRSTEACGSRSHKGCRGQASESPACPHPLGYLCSLFARGAIGCAESCTTAMIPLGRRTLAVRPVEPAGTPLGIARNASVWLAGVMGSATALPVMALSLLMSCARVRWY